MPVSCQPLIGLLVTKIHTTKKVKAEYPVPKGKTILALVESSLCETDQPVARMLTERLNTEFERQKIAAETIRYGSLLKLAAVAHSFSNMKPTDVGKKLGADIVCYVLIHKFKLKDESVGYLWRGEFEATVSMFDVATGRRLWPIGKREGHWVKPVRTPMASNSSPHYAAEFAASLCDSMADRIAKLFYDHKVPIESDESGQDRDVWGDDDWGFGTGSRGPWRGAQHFALRACA
jgi:hypothetical protein